MPKVSGVPSLQAAQKRLPVPIIINEYGWLWLTRDGQPTCLTDKVYESLLGKDSTVERRRLVYAKCLAAKTEFWRAHRECAGVLHFCGLGYSRPGDKPRPEGGATSDHWIDLEKLEFEPTFVTYVRDAFSPVGVMLDYWEETAPPRAQLTLPVYVINDLEPAWQGEVRLRVTRDGKTLDKQSRDVQVASFGRATLTFYAALPPEPGAYTLVAELDGPKMKIVRSRRDVHVQ